MLVALLLAPNRHVSVNTLVSLLWDDEPPAKARENLTSYVSRLKRVLRVMPDVELVFEPGGYRIGVDPELIDYQSFLRLVREAGECAERADDAHALDLYRAAEAEWRGEPLADMKGEWVEGRRARLAESHLKATLGRLAAEQALGRHAETIAELAEIARRRPPVEPAVSLLMTGLAGAGRHGEAIDAFHGVVQVLREELGTGPGPELRDTYVRILRHDPAPRRRNGSRAPDTLLRDTRLFTGRSTELERILGCAEQAQRGAGSVVTVDGMPGIGKTTLAIHAAHLASERFPDGRLYLDLHAHDLHQTALDPSDGLAGLLAVVGAGGTVPATRDGRAAAWRSWLSERRVVLVLDDAKDVDQVIPFLPGESPSLVIVTSRGGLSPIETSVALSLDVLPDGEAVAFFRRVSQREDMSEVSAVMAAVGFCGRLPLAISLFGAHLKRHPAHDVVDLLSTSWTPTTRHVRPGDPDSRLAETFDLSYRALDADQRLIFRRMGLHPGLEITLAAAAALAGCDLGRAERSLDVLVDRHLVTEPAVHRYQLHDLLRRHACDVASAEDPAEERRAATRRVFDYYLLGAYLAAERLDPHRDRMPVTMSGQVRGLVDIETDEQAHAWWDAERTSLLPVCEHAMVHGAPYQAAMLPHVLAWAFHAWGHLRRGAELHAAAVELWRGMGDHSGEAHARIDLSLMWLRSGAYDDATACARQALVICRRLADRRGEARSLDQLGVIAVLRSDYANALDHLRRARDIRHEVDDRYGEMESLDHLGSAYNYHGGFQDAVAHYQLAFEIADGLDDRQGIRRSLNNLGDVHHKLGRQDEALEYYQRALAFTPEDDRSSRTILLANFGEIHSEAGRHQQALDAYIEALDGYWQMGDRRGEIDVLNNIAVTHLALSQPGYAAEHATRALDIARVIGDTHEQARVLHTLGRVELDLARDAAALERFEESLRLASASENAFEEAQALDGTGTALLRLGRIAEARAAWQAALTRYDHLGVAEAASVRARLNPLRSA